MKKFKEFIVAYDGDGSKLKDLGIDIKYDSIWMPGTIDLNEVESWFSSREDADSEYTETNVQMHSGDSCIIKMNYDDFSELMNKEFAK